MAKYKLIIFAVIACTVLIFQKQLCSYLTRNTYIKTVIVIGASPKLEKLIVANLGTKSGDNIFNVSTTNMLKNLEKIGWIKHVKIYKKLPNIIKIQVTESQPTAIYYHNKRYTLIDKDGKLIENVTKNPNLLIVSGNSANTEFFNMLNLIKKFPSIINELHMLIYVRKRRWDLILKNKLIIKLPEQFVENALQKLTTLLQLPNVRHSAVSIDLRIVNNIIIQGLKLKSNSHI